MRLRGTPPDGVPSTSYVGNPNGSIVGSLSLPVGRLLPVAGLPGPSAFSEISELEIDEGTSITSRVISGRRAKYMIDKANLFTYNYILLLQDAFGNALLDKVDKVVGNKRVYANTSVGAVSSLGYDTEATPTTFPFRDTNGCINTATPTATTHAATKSYVDTADALKVDKTALGWRVYGTDGAGAQSLHLAASGATANTLAYRGSGGVLPVGTPVAAADATTKTYVDTADALKLNKMATANSAYLTDGTGQQISRLFTTAATAATVMYRDGSGRAQIVSPSAANDIANKTYVDTAVGTKAATVHTHVIADTTGLQAALDAKLNQAQVDARVAVGTAALVDTAPAALDTLNELAAALGDDPNFSTTISTQIGLKAPIASPTFTGTVSGITKAMVGLGSVDNTTDAAKPVSTATQTALNLKANLASPTFTGTVSGVTKAHVGLGSADNTADAAKNVLSATKLTTARTINGVSFDGSANISINAVDSTAREPAFAAGTTAQYRRGDKTWQTLNQDAVPDGTTNKAFTALEKTKLSGIATSATANSTDAALIARANHTGAQAISTVTGLQAALDAKATTVHTHVIGDTTGLQAALDAKAPLASPTFTGTVSGVTKTHVGLANVDNTTDAAKPVSTATQTALNLKANLASPTFTGTVSGITKTMVGLGSVDNTADSAKPVSTAQQTALDLKANLANPTFTGTVSGITKTMVGLGSVDNTADSAKPVSTAQQTALNLKANLASPAFTGTPTGITKTHVGLGNVDNTSDANKPVSTATAALLPVQITQAAYDALGSGRPARLYAIVG